MAYVNLNPKEAETLVNQALDAQQHAFAPYSGYKVGAAVISETGKIYVGANIENVIYRVTHAERMALDNMTFHGDRELMGIAVATKDGAYPCGQCLQDITEYDLNNEGIIETV